jgi:hypothetical protein
MYVVSRGRFYILKIYIIYFSLLLLNIIYVYHKYYLRNISVFTFH